MGFVLTIANTSILINYKKKIFISIYIDENIYAAKELQLLDKFETQLKEKFEVKLLGKTKLILGMLVKKNMKYRTLHLNYRAYIWNVLSTYDMMGANSVGTLIIKGSIILLGKGKDTKFNVTDY